jgi:hypothetical protein
MLAKTQAIEPGAGAGTRLVGRDTAGAQTESHILERGQMRKQQVILEDDADRAAFRREMDTAPHVLEDDPIELDASSIQRDESGDGAQERGLPSAVRSEHGDDLPGCGFDRDVEVESPKPDRDLRREHQKARK